MLRWTGRTVGRLLHVLGRVALGLAGLIAIGAAGLAWRLSQGPIALPWLAHRLEEAANGPGGATGGPTHLAVGSAALAWQGFRLGVDHPLDLRFADIRVLSAAGATLDRIAHVDVSVSLAALLVGHVAPRTILADGVRLHVLRAADGALSLNVGRLAEPLDSGAPPGRPASGSSTQGMLAEFANPSQSDLSPGERGRGAFRLNQLRQVSIQDAELTVSDKALGTDWRVAPAAIDLTRGGGGGVTGSAAAGIVLGDATMHATAEFQLEPGGKATRIAAHVTPFSPAALARAAPALQSAGGFEAPVQADLTLELGPDLAPRHFALKASVGAGAVKLGAIAASLSSASLDATGDRNAVQLHALQVVLAGPTGGAGPTIALHGTGSRADGRFMAQAAVDIDRVDFADLAHLWPEGVSRDARNWITQNVTAGTARNGHVEVTLQGPADLSAVSVTKASGQLEGDDVTLHWLRPLPPVEHAAARLTLLDPDTVQITTNGGHVAVGTGGITLHDGSMRIWGLTVKDQLSSITLNASGSIADVLALLANKRLHLLSAHSLPLQNPSGSFTADLAVQLPLDNKVTIDQIGIKAQAKLASVHLGAVAMGRDVDEGTFDLAVDNDGLKLSGTAQFARIPSQVGVTLDFRAGPPTGVTTRVEASGTASGAQLAAIGLDTAGVLDGPAAIQVVYSQQRAGPAEIQLQASLRAATLDTGQLGWAKAPGQAASAQATLRLDHDRLTAIDDVQAEGPGLSIHGSADIADGAPQTLLLQRAVIGRTDLHGSIRLATQKGEPIRIDFAGPQIDLAGQLGHKDHAKARSKPPAEHDGPPWQLQGRFDRVVLAGNHVVGPMSATAQSDGRVIRVARVQVTGGVNVLATIGPGGPGAGRELSITTDDAGSLLQALGVIDTVRGGRLALTGRFDDRLSDHPLDGNADITGFRLMNAPAPARVLQAMTLYGLLGTLRGPGLEVDRLIAPFRLDENRLTLNEARAFNPALGVTAKGQIDLDAQTADLQGTIVPAYLFNSFLGNIPVIGKLFSPEQGGGVFSATYSVRGSLADPAVSVNPLAALTPGFLRGVFGIFQSAPAK